MYRFGWNERMVGIAIASVGVCSAVVGAAMVEPVVAWLGERRTMLAGLLCGAAAFLIYGLARTGLGFWTGIPVTGLWGLSGPPMSSLMTRRVSATEQGKLQGALGSLRGIAFMIGPLLFTTTFASFIGPHKDWHLPGAPFILAALLLGASILIAWWATVPRAGDALTDVIGVPETAD
jgi:DHA1 family tetracycline resistance protein-like MFS transporter